MYASMILTQVILVMVVLFGVKKGFLKFDIYVKLLILMATVLIAILIGGHIIE